MELYLLFRARITLSQETISSTNQSHTFSIWGFEFLKTTEGTRRTQEETKKKTG